jgi:hypothetical protein
VHVTERGDLIEVRREPQAAAPQRLAKLLGKAGLEEGHHPRVQESNLVHVDAEDVVAEDCHADRVRPAEVARTDTVTRD